MRVLLLEDVDSDADLVRHEVLRAWPDAEFGRATGRDSFVAGLLQFRPDVILCDHATPEYTGAEALALTRSIAPDVPLIIVTGSLDEETAVECIKAGAADYVLKENLIRLVPAVEHALALAADRREHERALAQLRSTAERYRLLFSKHPHAMLVADRDSCAILEANEAAATRFGRSREALLTLCTADLVRPDDVTHREEVVLDGRAAYVLVMGPAPGAR